MIDKTPECMGCGKIGGVIKKSVGNNPRRYSGCVFVCRVCVKDLVGADITLNYKGKDDGKHNNTGADTELPPVSEKV